VTGDRHGYKLTKDIPVLRTCHAEQELLIVSSPSSFLLIARRVEVETLSLALNFKVKLYYLNCGSSPLFDYVFGMPNL